MASQMAQCRASSTAQGKCLTRREWRSTSTHAALGSIVVSIAQHPEQLQLRSSCKLQRLHAPVRAVLLLHLLPSSQWRVI